ncbi:hypothetical protein [Algibacter mikhailovii]|uniref:Uncharacterized protein n=1 Tax=Algibacter mikhailovii TaxID=425498 RepID=A0A918V955_9FLAO|nr:hypothetical protein [Algibacter mikhailovii]GGZ81813.1 hypothetical protein GCM10007028_19310 [Algibacter mikhailovii]
MLVATTDDLTIIDDVSNTTYDTNHNIITGCNHNYLIENRHFPSMSAIIEETKLSRQPVYNNLKTGLKAKHNSLVQGENEIMTMKAL